MRKYIVAIILSLVLVISISLGTSIKKSEVYTGEDASFIQKQAEKLKDKDDDKKSSDEDKEKDDEDIKAGTDNSSSKNDSNSSSTQGDNSSSSSNQAYKDGTYTGTGKGFRGNMDVSVVIESGKIKSVSITSTSDDEKYLSRARALLTSIVEKQSSDVSVVSRATYSSRGIIEATKDALNKAK